MSEYVLTSVEVVQTKKLQSTMGCKLPKIYCSSQLCEEMLMDTFLSPAVLSPWIGFQQLGTAQTPVLLFAGKRWYKLLHVTCFLGGALLGTSHSSYLLPDLYRASSLTDHLSSCPQPQMQEGLKLKIKFRLKKSCLQLSYNLAAHFNEARLCSGCR